MTLADPGSEGAMIDVTPLEIPAVDGFALAATLYEPLGRARATVAIHPATAVLRRYYDPYARFLAGRGLRAVTFDYRGIGGSRRGALRGFAATMSDWARLDTDGVHAWLSAKHPRAPVLAVAHSFGGQALGMLEHRRRLRGAVLVAAQSGHWRHWRGRSRLTLWPFWHLAIPILTALFGYFPAQRLGISEDLPAGVAREWARWGRRRDYLLSEGGEERRRAYAGLAIPMLAYSFPDDGYAPRAAVEALLGFYAGAGIEHRRPAPRDLGAAAVGHFGFFRERFRDTLWHDSAVWLEAAARS